MQPHLRLIKHLATLCGTRQRSLANGDILWRVKKGGDNIDHRLTSELRRALLVRRERRSAECAEWMRERIH